MKQYLSRLLAFVLVIAIGLVGCSSGGTLSGDYRQDTLSLVNSLRTAIELPQDAAEKAQAQAEAREVINEYVARYARDPARSKLSSFTTMRTALNGLAGHYNFYPNRPVPQKLKKRLNQQFSQVEAALKRGA
ncbi:MAG: photosystem II protein Psb27 [Oscillatoria sp. SIO1A7]|nr:photosystem II protein Psb27 [Oscillatoria sp. SIO1A7]